MEFYRKTALVLLLLLSVSGLAIAQTYTGKAVIWELSKATEPRLKIKFGTSGINSGGYEGTTMVFENVSASDLFIETKLTITDLCGVTKIRTVKVTVKAKSKLGGSTWMGGDEQYDYSTPCKDRKTYAQTMVTKIAAISLEIISVKDVSKPGTAGSQTGTIAQNKPAGSTKTGSGSNCNAEMPQIVLSEQGQHYLKLADGSFQKITKEQYARFKQINSPEEKKRFIQSCTGNPLDTMRLQAKPYTGN